MTAQRRRRARLALLGVFVALVCVGGIAMAINVHTGDHEGLLPPVPEPAAEAPQTQESAPSSSQYTESDFGAEAPGAARLAGDPESVVQRFAQDWANRNTVLTEAIKREMVGLSAGAWAGAIFRQARLTLPAIEGVSVEGGLVMMKLRTVTPQSKTALVVTQERFVASSGELAAPRYELYLARLDQVTPGRYAITAWEPQR